LALYGHTFEIDRDRLVIDCHTFEIDRDQLVIDRHTFESDRDQVEIDAVTLAMSAGALPMSGNAGAWL